MTTLPPLTATPAQAYSADRTTLGKAAKGFEAIFVRQMLAAARSTSLVGKDPIFGSQAQETFTAMRDERFAEIAATSGAFGLARQLEAQFAQLLPQTPAAKD
jgi:flagellar protein FlgJ